jgi:biopolymer transport protein TolR
MGASMQGGGGGGGRIGVAGRRSRSHRQMSEINVTPFVDVMLVLLVVFMITAPLLSSGVPVDLPKTDAKPISSTDDKPLEISLNKNGKLYIGETEVDRDKLVNLLSSMTNDDPDRRIFIRADMALSYGHVMDILGVLNGAGFRKVALISVQGAKAP